MKPSNAPTRPVQISKRRWPMCARPSTRAGRPRRATIRQFPSAPITETPEQHFNSSHGVFDVRGTLTVPFLPAAAFMGTCFRPMLSSSKAATAWTICAPRSTPTFASRCSTSSRPPQQLTVAQSNVDLAEQSLTQSRDRFAAGVTDTVEVVQAQETVASAHQTYISSLYSYNYAKISLARAMGAAEEGVKEYFKGK